MINLPSISFPLHTGFKGFVAGITNPRANYKQQAFVDVRGSDGHTITSTTFASDGIGRRKPMKRTSESKYWSFGPFAYDATVHVTISYDSGDGFKPSKMVGPLRIDKKPEDDYPKEFHVWTVISEDGADQSHDDCTVQVLQYK
ncbi:hypothetical protein BV22DRAFT_1041386 [Leucogyrophana mollusca]|uniref:Uncharacterized protein n=1 Tax=Leucogyrophana mollusca TaxID=85980 RepID=A0ACB8B2H2_9AGAM|nr:hypothetical protein BV22DRAFT_1041386 [Leucogyrophana mollusca]